MAAARLRERAAEFLWLTLPISGVEPTKPASLLDATFPNIDVHMTYSRILVPGFIQGLIVFALVQAVWRDRPLALWCGTLTVVHVLCDLLAGFQHQRLAPAARRSRSAHTETCRCWRSASSSSLPWAPCSPTSRARRGEDGH